MTRDELDVLVKAEIGHVVDELVAEAVAPLVERLERIEKNSGTRPDLTKTQTASPAVVAEDQVSESVALAQVAVLRHRLPDPGAYPDHPTPPSHR